jgi:hypothetical protein
MPKFFYAYPDSGFGNLFNPESGIREGKNWIFSVLFYVILRVIVTLL